jgi:CRISPR-associated endonuclease/helicase Cas3
LHSQFTVRERQEREDRFLTEFGKDRKGRPERALLIATQVIEQSLDLDFDLMVSELAPVDLILQRMGRLHRHAGRMRPDRVASPRLMILKPQEEKGLPQFGKFQYVYAPWILLRSLAVLQEKPEIRVPAEVSALIAFVYEQDSISDLPKKWQERAAESLKEFHAQRSEQSRKAEGVLLNPPRHVRDYWRDPRIHREEDEDPETAEDFQAVTRLGSPSITVICVHEVDGEWYFDEEGREELSRFEVPGRTMIPNLLGQSFSYSARGSKDRDRDFQKLIHSFACPPEWKRNGHLRFCAVVPFRNRQAALENHLLRWDRELGIVREKKNA